ncbi:unnamed protein product [Adineta ricciae]|uniref:Uncharacterized protein n=1 Tax=Adineta ricciae TaxID=249248 RepID=A0A815HSN4_ADIRI|nr:unnamed protein product [Adineta ricciae]
MGPYVSKVSNDDTQIITYNWCDAAKLLEQITAVINEKVPNGVHKLCLFQHCRSTAVEISVVDEPPAYSTDTPASVKKSPEKIKMDIKSNILDDMASNDIFLLFLHAFQ